jgi:large subunit ribosomal protein L32
MSVPKKKTSHSKARMRRNHQALSPKILATCPRCNVARRPHTVCSNCGAYGEKTIFDVEAAETE